MKRLKRILPLMLMIVSLLVIPLNAYATEKDFGNYAGDEDFSYDSNWQVETEKPTAASIQAAIPKAAATAAGSAATAVPCAAQKAR